MATGVINGEGIIGISELDIEKIEKQILDGGLGSVDSVFGRVGVVVAADGDYTASKITNTTIDGLTAVNVQDALEQLNTKIQDALAGVIDGGASFRDSYDASSNLFPSTGGSGDAGAILSGDFWLVIVGGTLGSKFIPAGNLLFAIANNPGQTESNWTAVPKFGTDIDFSVLLPATVPTSKTDELLINSGGSNKKITTEDLLTAMRIKLEDPDPSAVGISLTGDFQEETLVFQTENIPGATQTAAGVLTAADKILLDNAAPLDSPEFTGTPKAPLQAPNTGTTIEGVNLLATCGYVDNLIDNLEDHNLQIVTSDKVVMDISGVAKLTQVADILGNVLLRNGTETSNTLDINLDIDYSDASVTNATVTLNSATETTAGLLSAADKSKIDNSEVNAIVAALIFGS
jgi:hypothetical protein